MNDRLLVGVDVGGTKTAVVLATDPAHVLWRAEFETRPQRGPEPALARIVDLARQGCSHLGGVPGCIGVSCGGPLDHVRGVIHAPPNLPTWIDVPIKQLLEREFGVTCVVENDANAGAIAEHRFGAGRGADHMVFLTMGTGLGAGLILNGRLYRGASALAGEIGHVGLTDHGPEGYGKVGSVEGWASGAGMARHGLTTVHSALRSGEPTLLEPMQDGLTARNIAEAMARGDAVATRIVEHTGYRLGEALAILVDVLNPERIIVGGLAMRLGDALLRPACERMHALALAPSAQACTVLPAALGESIGDVAALSIASTSHSAADVA